MELIQHEPQYYDLFTQVYVLTQETVYSVFLLPEELLEWLIGDKWVQFTTQ